LASDAAKRGLNFPRVVAEQRTHLQEQRAIGNARDNRGLALTQSAMQFVG
jgi:hypothetical protein